MKQIRHLSTNIEELLRNFKNRKMTGLFDDENGKPMSDKEIRKELAELQAKGHKLIGSDKCEGFDPFGGGCPGHPIEDEQ